MPIFSTLVGLINGTISGFFTNYVAALIILLVGFMLANLLGQLFHKVLGSLAVNKLVKRTGLGISLEEIISGFIRYAVYLMAIILALNQIGLTKTLLQGVCIAVILIVTISIILAIKDFAPNLIAGLYLMHGSGVKPGDSIEFDNTKGKIIGIHMLESRLQTDEKEFLIVPNSTFIKKLIKIKK